MLGVVYVGRGVCWAWSTLDVVYVAMYALLQCVKHETKYSVSENM